MKIAQSYNGKAFLKSKIYKLFTLRNYLAPCLSSYKLSKKDEIKHTGKVRKNSLVISLLGILHMDVPGLANQQRLTSVLSGHWMTSRGSVKSVG